MDASSYVSNRVDDQIKWYDKKSRTNKNFYIIFRSIEFILATAIPLIAGFGENVLPVPLLVAILGAIIAILSLALSLNQFQENWTKYRVISESLKCEKYMFLTGSQPYNDKNSLNLFVQKIEGLIAKENLEWQQYTEKALSEAKSIQHSRINRKN